MNYEEFKELWTWALRESGLSLVGLTPIEESLDLQSTDRHCKSFVCMHERVATFHVSAALGFRWDTLQTARTRCSEEDMVRELFGLGCFAIERSSASPPRHQPHSRSLARDAQIDRRVWC